MSEGGQAEARAEKPSAGRDKAQKPAAPVQGVLEAGAETSVLAAGMASALVSADPRQRSKALLKLQRTKGNAFVQRLIRRQDAAKTVPSLPTPVGRDAKTQEPAPAFGAPEVQGSPWTGKKSAPNLKPESGQETLNAGSVSWTKHEDFPRVMGQTYYARKDIEMWPSYRSKLERAARMGLPPWGWQAKVQTTDAAGGVWNARATPENEEGYKMAEEHSKYPGYEYHIRESGAAANMIAAAEQQHINDIDTGWAITGLAARDAINKAAGADMEVNEQELPAKKAAADKTAEIMGPLGTKIRSALDSQGRLEDALGPMMDNAVRQSVAQRDTTNNHTIPLRYVMKDDRKKKVLFEVNDDFKLDATPSESVVNIGTIG